MSLNTVTSLDKTTMRSINQYKVLYIIRDCQPISRPDIAKRTGLSRGAVSTITGHLLDKNLLLEKEIGVSIGGRRPALLALNPEGAYTIGVFLSEQRINVVIINLQADILAEHSMFFEEKDTSPEVVAEKITQAVHLCISNTQLTLEQISGIGLAVPGLIASPDSLVKFVLNYQWKNIHFKEILNKKLSIPIYIENSVKCVSLAEQWFGEGKDVDNFIVVNLAQGIAIGIVINGQLYTGTSGMAGEFGHTTIDSSGPLCRCGKTGCFEAFTGNHAILNRARELALEGQWKTDMDLNELTIEDIVRSAHDGEETLIALYQAAGRALGIGVANLMQIFNPSKIIITGRGTIAGNLLFDSMHETIPQFLPGNGDNRAEIVVPTWKHTDAARGAGVKVLQEIYQVTQDRKVSK